MKSLIYYSFIAGLINFTSVMKDVSLERRQRNHIIVHPKGQKYFLKTSPHSPLKDMNHFE